MYHFTVFMYLLSSLLRRKRGKRYWLLWYTASLFCMLTQGWIIWRILILLWSLEGAFYLLACVVFILWTCEDCLILFSFEKAGYNDVFWLNSHIQTPCSVGWGGGVALGMKYQNSDYKDFNPANPTPYTSFSATLLHQHLLSTQQIITNFHHSLGVPYLNKVSEI